MEPIIKPIPSELLPPDKRFMTLKNNKVLFKPPFTCAVVGAICAGKSSFADSLLNDHYKNYFDELIVLCGTIDSKSSWENINQKKVVFLNALDEPSFQEYLQQLEEDQEERKAKGKFPIRVLLVLDDCIFDNFNKNKGVIEKLFMTCRHYFISIILCLQHSKMILPSIRNQIFYWVLFRLTSNDQKKIAIEHSNLLSTDQFEHMYTDVMMQGKHEFLVIDYKEPLETRFKHRFTKTIDLEDYLHK